MARKINHDSVNILMYSKDRNLISKNGDSESIERHGNMHGPFTNWTRLGNADSRTIKTQGEGQDRE